MRGSLPVQRTERGGKFFVRKKYPSRGVFRTKDVLQYDGKDAADCCEDTAAVEAFDATFPEKEKKWMPGQEEFYL